MSILINRARNRPRDDRGPVDFQFRNFLPPVTREVEVNEEKELLLLQEGRSGLNAKSGGGRCR
jgi:hypothetical protein